MATIKIEKFAGIAPRTHSSLLPDGMAIKAHNCKLKNGKLVPLKEPKPVSGIAVNLENGLSDVGLASSLHIWKRNDGGVEFLAFPGMTWIAEGNIADDEYSRIIVSGDTGVEFEDSDGRKWKNTPQIYMRSSKDGHKIIHPVCKNPLPPPMVSRDSSVPLGENRRYTYFFWTWVDEYGYESPVSDESRIMKDGAWVKEDIEYNDGDSIRFDPITVNELPLGADKVRIYKVVTGTENGSIQFVKEVHASAVLGDEGFIVKVKDEDAGEVMSSMESPPPDLKNIIRVFGGGAFYAGFSESNRKTVCFSDVDLLYSWPISYRYDVDENIVALATTSNTVYALTDGYPYVISGTAPESMTVYPLAGPSACVSARSVCVYRNSVYYASRTGISVIYNNADNGTVVSNITDKIWTKEQWEDLNPSSCVIVQHDGALHCWFDSKDGPKSYMVDLLESDCAVTTNDENSVCACVDNWTDRMYFVRKG